LAHIKVHYINNEDFDFANEQLKSKFPFLSFRFVSYRIVSYRIVTIILCSLQSIIHSTSFNQIVPFINMIFFFSL
jgi:hypothetical protein